VVADRASGAKPLLGLLFLPLESLVLFEPKPLVSAGIKQQHFRWFCSSKEPPVADGIAVARVDFERVT